jgi:NAD(P)-dependent dehydrogenase (short-subunit alcohol dehydrogenase family)
MNQILIYGATGGIGFALAQKLAATGAKLHLVGRHADRLQEAAHSLNARFTVGDVLEPATFVRVMDDIEAAPLTGLVYAVGSITLKPIARLTDADVLNDFTLNAQGAFRAVQAAVPRLKEAGAASVVLFSSVAVTQGFTAHASISMAKGAVEGLVRALATELAPHIRVNAVAPSLTDTPLASALTSNATMANAIAQLHALQRLGTPADIANAAAFLLGEESAWMTGQILHIDGGRSRLRTKG